MKSCCKEAMGDHVNEETLAVEERKPSFLQKLKKKWNAKNMLQVVLILITFTIGGSLCGYLGRKILNLMTIENNVIWVVLYIILVSILWPACVLLISIPMGQLAFFRKYLSKMGKRMFRR